MATTGRLTTHVLDTANGKPAAGMEIGLVFIAGPGSSSDDEVELILTTITNADGRCDAPLLDGASMKPGTYELLFQVADYFESQGFEGGAPAFLDQVPVRFGISDINAHYHVPLLVSPFAYSTYRGS